MPRDTLIKNIEDSIIELVNFATKMKSTRNNVFTCCNNKMVRVFSGLVIPKMASDNGKNWKVNLQNDVRWCSPKYGWVQVSFDGASKGNPSPKRNWLCCLRQGWGGSC